MIDDDDEGEKIKKKLKMKSPRSKTHSDVIDYHPNILTSIQPHININITINMITGITEILHLLHIQIDSFLNGDGA